MSTSIASHRDDSHRKSRAVRLGAILLAVVGVTAAATSAGFSDDAWFAGGASSAGVELQGKLADDPETAWKDADENAGDLAVQIPTDTFANMVPGQTRTVKLDIKNASTVELGITDNVKTTGALFEGTTPATAELSTYNRTLDAGDEETVTLTVTAGNWADDLQNKEAKDNTITVQFTGTPTDQVPAGTGH